ncbi:MAG: hypothetical protein COS76_02380 [Candidatus Portnoybacteria bacterium CG06_land_8_20_14_3_00_39_12]|uniref:Uncharacterized protein n=2 Tax=Candidatus Portnoyibacteriota TaxID=1817913 RepID=A0A2M8KG47_9BACT|nr:MAG: hypothetical protein AUJ33_00485 [Parcubacteria group bacterium CG1_02_40_25]PIU75143.1 MAG: hypothetical protein COS76_02380 [Candidatus Portnoybacteria bacterium CG06_land_8_20_14_3_00_39_12]PJE58877.1 MAG: hypothetical protein COU83_01475 [Candidatus Portnoybacteria bacterium CG10_big_fil_rev_8_21_14_0_10_40_22]
MAFTTPEQKKLKIFTIIFVIMLVITLVIVYFGFWRKPSSPTPTVSLPVTNDVSGLNNPKIDWQFLDSQTFKELKFFGENPVTPGDQGRQNPFIPF